MGMRSQSNGFNFVKDDRKEKILSALLSDQKKIIIENVEIFLTPLKKDTFEKREVEANKQADELIKLLDD